MAEQIALFRCPCGRLKIADEGILYGWSEKEHIYTPLPDSRCPCGRKYDVEGDEVTHGGQQIETMMQETPIESVARVG